MSQVPQTDSVIMFGSVVIQAWSKVMSIWITIATITETSVSAETITSIFAIGVTVTSGICWPTLTSFCWRSFGSVSVLKDFFLSGYFVCSEFREKWSLRAWRCFESSTHFEFWQADVWDVVDNFCDDLQEAVSVNYLLYALGLWVEQTTEIWKNAKD